VPKQAASFHF